MITVAACKSVDLLFAVEFGDTVPLDVGTDCSDALGDFGWRAKPIWSTWIIFLSNGFIHQPPKIFFVVLKREAFRTGRCS